MCRRHDGVDARLARSSRSMRFPRRDARSRLPSTGLMELEGNTPKRTRATLGALALQRG